MDFISFLEHIKEVPDHRAAGMVTYPWDEISLATLAGALCGADDWEAVELLSREYLGWLKQFLPSMFGVPHAQTFLKVFRLLKPEVLEEHLASWFASLQEVVRGVIAMDGKTLRGSKKSADGSGPLHLLSAYACEALSSDSAPLMGKATRSRRSPRFWTCWRSRPRLYRSMPWEHRRPSPQK